MKTKKLNEYMNIVGPNIRKYRELRSISQRQLVDKLSLLYLSSEKWSTF